MRHIRSSAKHKAEAAVHSSKKRKTEEPVEDLDEPEEEGEEEDDAGNAEAGSPTKAAAAKDANKPVGEAKLNKDERAWDRSCSAGREAMQGVHKDMQDAIAELRSNVADAKAPRWDMGASKCMECCCVGSGMVGMDMRGGGDGEAACSTTPNHTCSFPSFLFPLQKTWDGGNGGGADGDRISV